MNIVSQVCEKQLRVFSRVVSWKSVWVLSIVCWLKKVHNPEADHSAFFGEHTEDLSPGNNLSALRHCSEEVREEPGYTGVLVNKQTNKKQVASKDYCWKENQISHFSEFNIFLCMGRWENLDSLKSSFW